MVEASVRLVVIRMDEKMEECIQNCLDCYRICLETKKYCLEKGGEYANPEHIQKLEDCLELCKMSADFMIAESGMHGKVCEVCREACKRCAESCAMMSGDEQMQGCAEMCRQCEASCREMAGM